MKTNSLFHTWAVGLALLMLCLPRVADGMFISHTLPTQALLPVATVHCIFQDSEGFMWYGTTGGGLCRDNGYQVDVFRSDGRTPGLLANNNVRCIAEDSVGGIWFGTEKRLYRLDKRSWKLTEPLSRLETMVSALFLDSHHNMWVATSVGVYCINPSNGKVLVCDKTEGIRQTTQFVEDHLGRIWLSTWNGAPYIYKKAEKRFKPLPWNLPIGVVRMVEDVAQDGFWMATWGKGIVFYDLKTAQVVLQPQTMVSHDGANCIDMLVDKRQGLLWVTTLDDLYLYKREGKRLIQLDTSTFLPTGHKILDGLCEDRQGNMWVAGFMPHTFIVSNSGRSVVRETVPAIQMQTGFPLLPDRMVADEGGYWIWQGRVGLMRYLSATDKLTMAGGMRFARGIAKDRTRSGIWAMEGKFLKHLLDDGKSVVESEASAFPTTISCLLDDGAGSVLVGTQDAVYRYSVLGNATRKIASSSAKVLALAASADARVYFATADKKLWYCDGKGNVTQIKCRRSENFTALALAPDGTLWCATQQGSVYSLAQGSKELVHNKQMSNANGDAIIDMKTDRTGHVWLLANQYLREYNPRNDAFRTLRNTDPDIAVSYFYSLESLGDNRMAVDGAGAYLKLEASQMLDQQNASGTQPCVTTVLLGDSVLLLNSQDKMLEVPSDVSSLALRCSTFDPMNASKVTFAYKIEGWNKDWVYLPQGVNSIYLANLPKGKYRLLLRATDRYGCWSIGETEYTLHRLPSWWETWWAYLLYAVIAVGILYEVWRLNRRIRLLRRLQQRRKMLALTEVSISPEELKKEQPHTDEFLKRVIEKIEQHLDDTSYSVEKLSSDMCMSRMNLYRKIQAISGLSPNEFMKDIKLKKAAAILKRYPDMTISQLAAKVGFATPKYFSKCFKEKFGVLPSQYGQGRAPDKT